MAKKTTKAGKKPAGKKPGGNPHNPPPATTGDLDLTASNWRATPATYPYTLSNEASGALKAPIGATDETRLDYLHNVGRRALVLANVMEASYDVVGAGQFKNGGDQLGAENEDPPFLPTIRLFFASYSVGPPVGGTAEDGRWWSRTGVSFLDYGSGLILTDAFDPAHWSNVNGHYGTDRPAEFAAALQNIVAMGVTLGNNRRFGHGVFVDGQADLFLTRVTIR